MNDWHVAEPDVATIKRSLNSPLDALAGAETPALVIRQAASPGDCESLVRKLIQRELLYDPLRPMPESFRDQVIPEGHYRDGLGRVRSALAAASDTAAGEVDEPRRRIDIGSSLGYRGSDKEAFLAHSEQTWQLFDSLFDDFDPVRICYQHLRSLAGGKRVVTAHEPDGRRYGPAIIRAHYGGYAYAPHFDSVRLREKREDYAVHEFEHQFAGVLVLQNTSLNDDTAQCVIHDCLWTEELDEPLRKGRFHEYAAERGIRSQRVVLEPGDLYFFNTRAIHEVPGVAGQLPRIVLACFIGYSSDRDEIFVWS